MIFRWTLLSLTTTHNVWSPREILIKIWFLQSDGSSSQICLNRKLYFCLTAAAQSCVGNSVNHCLALSLGMPSKELSLSFLAKTCCRWKFVVKSLGLNYLFGKFELLDKWEKLLFIVILGPKRETNYSETIENDYMLNLFICCGRYVFLYSLGHHEDSSWSGLSCYLYDLLCITVPQAFHTASNWLTLGERGKHSL